MSRILLLITSILIFSSCNKNKPDEIKSDRVNRISYGRYDVIIIDSCEYIESDFGASSGRVYSLIHKANCKNCNGKNSK